MLAAAAGELGPVQVAALGEQLADLVVDASGVAASIRSRSVPGTGCS